MSHKNYRKETNCLNCGAEVTGKFCANCGQENLDTHENFFHIAGHVISDFLHYDSKFFRSLIPLFTRPGFLTKEYWEGKRVNYIHPLRLFFFITIIFVITSGVFYKHFEGEIKNAFRPNSAFTHIDDQYLNSQPDTAKVFIGQGLDSLTVQEVKEAKIREVRQMGKLRTGLENVVKSLKYVTFLLLPAYALIFKLLYIRRKSFYVDHLVYMMHVQSFIYSVLSVAFLLPLIIPLSMPDIVRIFILSIFVYLIFSLRYLYQQAWWKTVLKSLIAAVSIFLTTIMVIVGIAAFDAIVILP